MIYFAHNGHDHGAEMASAIDSKAVIIIFILTAAVLAGAYILNSKRQSKVSKAKADKPE